jgi:hypothetical protein
MRQDELPIRPGSDTGAGAVQEKDRLGVAFTAVFAMRREVAGL